MKNYQFNSDLILRDSSPSPLTVRAGTLSLSQQDGELMECRLTFQVNSELYQRIDTEALFNLNPEVRGSFSAGEFLPERDIEIATSLKLDLLPRLAEFAANIDGAAAYILSLSQEQPENPLLSEASWLALSVKQSQESEEIGYRTLWDYLNPAAIARLGRGDSAIGEEISNAIANFFKDWAETNLTARTQNSAEKMLEGLTDFVAKLADVNLDEFSPPETSGSQIFEEMVNFFQADEWPFYHSQGKPILQMVFQGESGKWTCYAKAREEQQQFVFYSICPVNAPENKRLAVAEFITRANYNAILGNFEMDFEDGEIRYKTSIDVEGDRLSFSLIKQLVYTNVTVMDDYLPGIMSVIYGDVSPSEAIAQIET